MYWAVALEAVFAAIVTAGITCGAATLLSCLVVSHIPRASRLGAVGWAVTVVAYVGAFCLYTRQAEFILFSPLVRVGFAGGLAIWRLLRGASKPSHPSSPSTFTLDELFSQLTGLCTSIALLRVAIPNAIAIDPWLLFDITFALGEMSVIVAGKQRQMPLVGPHTRLLFGLELIALIFLFPPMGNDEVAMFILCERLLFGATCWAILFRGNR